MKIKYILDEIAICITAYTAVLIYFPIRWLLCLRPKNRKEELRNDIVAFYRTNTKEKLIFGDYGKTFAKIKAPCAHEILKNTIGYSWIKQFYVEIEIDKLIAEGVLE